MVQLMKRWLSGGMMLLPLFLLSVILTILFGGNSSNGSQSRGLPVAPTREPGIKMIGVNAEITQDSRPIQRIKSRTARFNSDSNARDYQTVLMDDLSIQFFDDESTPTGKASSPRGKMWLADNEKTRAKRNDLLLVENATTKVEYHDRMENLFTDSIFYYYSAHRLVSGPYKRYFQYGPDSYLATGLKMEAQLTTTSTQLVKIRELGKPVVWRKIEQKDMKP